MNTYPALELRSSVRFPLKLRAWIRSGDTSVETETHDISAGGVLFLLDTGMELGSPIDFKLELPSDALGAKHAVEVQCVGRVMRCTPEAGRYAVAAVIDEYRFVHSQTAGER